MLLDIKTLALIQCIIFITQVIVLFVQFKIDKTYRGIGWWVLGTACMSLGVIFMPLVTVKSLFILATLANPLMIIGQILLYIGILRFLENKEKRFFILAIFTVFIISYNYYIYVSNELTARTIIVNTTLAAVTLMSAYNLIFKRDRLISVSANFTAIVFIIYGCFLILRVLIAVIMPPMHTYQDQQIMLIAGFIVPTIFSTLWTFGFIIMLNERLKIEIQESEDKYRSILDASPDDITITDLNGRIELVSPASKKMFGYEQDFERFVGMQIVDFIVPEDVKRAKANIEQMYQGGHSKPNEYLAVRKDHSTFNIEVNSGFIHSSNGKPIKMVFIIRDITKRKLSEQRIQKLVQQLEIERNTAHQNSITDSLTGLANRRYFDDMLTTEFYRMKRSESNMSLIMLDVDYFKKFNDTYGHLEGDECLRQIGKVLKSIVGRVTDIPARYGGEEFVVILPDTEEKGAIMIAECIRKAVIELAIPHSGSDISEWVTVSIGVAAVSASSVTSPEQVITLVDEALYRAKKGGRNQIQENILS